MFTHKLRYYFVGYLVIAVHGKNTEKLVNLAIRHRIPIWDIQDGSDYTCLKIDVDSFFELRHLARQAACRLQILRKVGLPFFYRRVMKRRGLVIGLCLFIGALYFLSSLIFFIEVEGNEKLETSYIIQLAQESGAQRGLFKGKLDQNSVAEQMLIKEPLLEWVGLHVQGTHLLIEVVEKINPSVETDEQSHMVAAKDGLVIDVLVITGEAKVKTGDTVRRGQLLIEGILRPESPYLAEEEQVPAVPVKARGEVMARVWYEGHGEAAITEIRRLRTGQRFTNWSLLINGQSVLRIGRTSIPYLDYDTETDRKSFSERIIRFPVEIITETHYEVEQQKKKIATEEALQLATERAKVLAELQLPLGQKVEDVTIEKIPITKEGIVAVRYVLETLENIAVAGTFNGGE